MTDRELLEAAAKAVGFEFNGVWFDERTGLLVWEPPTNYESRDWNPLTDDGDALRLAVALGLRINTPKYKGYGSSCENQVVFLQGGCPYAQTRRAVVRAAAAMKEKT